MALEIGFKRIKREVGIKRCVIIDGNVGDVYLDDKNQIVDLKKYLTEMLEDLKYDDIVYWDRVSGIEGDISSLKITEEKEVEGEEYSLDDEDENQNTTISNGNFKEPSEIFNLVFKNLTNKNRKTVFILNWSDYLFSNGGQHDNEERQNLTLLGKSIKDKKVNYLSTDVNESTIILITNKLSNFPLSFYQANPEVSTITLSKPDRLERRRLLEKIEAGFELKFNPGETLLNSSRTNEYIDVLEDFTNREIIQMAKLSRKEEKLTFDKLYLLFKYGEKDNPWEKLAYEDVKNIKKKLSERVVGQDEAIEKIEKTVVKAYMGLTGLHKTSSRSMPKGVFFFVGPTGVGKTELSKALAKFLFGDEQACIRFDMSEYAQENSDQKLIGAPPGYVGYEQGGQLTEKVRRKPYSIVLFDEIEKAHQDVFNLLLQVLDEGRLTDGLGRKVDFKNTIIIMTSNVGTRQLKDFGKGVGFDNNVSDDKYVGGINSEYSRGIIQKALNRTFPPEFLNRVDDVIIFDQLSKQTILSIIDIEIDKLRTRVQNLGYDFTITDEAKEFIAERGYDVQFGARPLKRAVQKYIEDELSEIIIKNGIKEGQTMKLALDSENKKIVLDIEKKKATRAKKKDTKEEKE